MGSTAALPVLSGSWPVPAASPAPMLPALQSLQLLPAALTSLAGTLSSTTDVTQLWAEASKLAGHTPPNAARIPPPGSSAIASSANAATSVHAGAPPSLSHLLHASGMGTGASAAGGSSPELAIDSLSNIDPPPLSVPAPPISAVPILPHPAALPVSLQGLLTSRDVKGAEDAGPSTAGASRGAQTVFATPSGDVAGVDAMPSRAGSVVGGFPEVAGVPAEFPGRAGSSINSLPGAVSAETAPEGEQSQNVSEGVPRGSAVEYTSRPGEADAQMRGLPLQAQSSAPGMLVR